MPRVNVKKFITQTNSNFTFFMFAPCINNIKTLFIVRSGERNSAPVSTVNRTPAQQADIPP
jgi:hypothetical protein